MAQITSLDDCLNYTEEINKVIPKFQDLIDRVRNESKELEKNDMYYGAKTFSCGDYIPIKLKVNTIIESSKSVIEELRNARKEAEHALYCKANDDLIDYQNYIEDTYLAPNRKHYYYARDNINMGNMEEAKKYRTGYNIYNEYYPLKVKAEQKIAELLTTHIYTSSDIEEECYL